MGVITPFITSTVPPRRACYHVPIKKHGSRDEIEVGLLSIFEVLQGQSKVAGRMPLGQRPQNANVARENVQFNFKLVNDKSLVSDILIEGS